MLFLFMPHEVSLGSENLAAEQALECLCVIRSERQWLSPAGPKVCSFSTCRERCTLRLNVFPHCSQMNGRSPTVFFFPIESTFVNVIIVLSQLMARLEVFFAHKASMFIGVLHSMSSHGLPRREGLYRCTQDKKPTFAHESHLIVAILLENTSVKGVGQKRCAK